MNIDCRGGSQGRKHLAAYDTATSREYILAARRRAIDKATVERQGGLSGIGRLYLSYGTPIKYRELILEGEQGELVSRDIRPGEIGFHNIGVKQPNNDAILVWDVAGQGGFKQYYPGVTAELSTTLVDFRKDSVKQAEQEAGIEVVESDILDPKIRGAVKKFINKYDSRLDPKQRGIDVALCALIGGWATILGTTHEGVNTKDPRATLLEWMVANRIYQTLRPGKGTMYFQLGRTGNYNEWMNRLQNNGIHAIMGTSYYDPWIRITKSSEKQNLPFLPPHNKP